LQTAATAGAAAGLGEWAALLPFSPASAAEARVSPDLVRFGPDLEPVVRLIEETPRAKCPAVMVGQLRRGLPYRHFLAALFLANMRTEGVGHPSAVLHSANQLSLDAPVQERLLPLFWAMDSFKFHQERDRALPRLRALAGELPAADQAEKELHAGMKGYDGGRAERAVVVLARTQGSYRVMEPLWHYGARDWTFIGHLAIWAANTWRVLETIGWQHAEPTLRVLVQSILGDEKGLKGQPYAANRERVEKAAGRLPADWAEGGGNPGLTRDLLGLWREGQGDRACALAAAQLVASKGRAGAVWDAVHLAAGELVLCSQPQTPDARVNGDALHSNTVTNALHFAFRLSGRPEDRLLILLQALGWVHLFRRLLQNKGLLAGKQAITEVVRAEIPDRPEAAAEQVLALRSSHPHEAAAQAFAFARRWPDAQVLLRAAGRLLPLKASWDPHDLKFPVAMFEDYGQVSPPWRPHKLAAAVFSFQGSDRPDTAVIQLVREALRKL
jgi:hypothetical protein